MLDQWAREQDAKPWLRFSTSGAFGSDPGDETEAVGDIDPVRATELGFKNLKRNMQWIQSATVKPTEDFDVLAELYNRQIGQFRTELGHVANLVGGMNSQEKYGDQPGPRFVPVPKARQAAGDEVHRGQRPADADVAHRHRHPAQDRAERRGHAHRGRAVGADCEFAQRRQADAAHRDRSVGEESGRGVHARRDAERSPPWRVHRDLWQRSGEDRRLSSRAAARVSARRRQQDQSAGGRRRRRAVVAAVAVVVAAPRPRRRTPARSRRCCAES